MRLPFLEPMFDDRPSVFGLPSELVLLLVAAALLLAGATIALRIGRGDREPRSFRATTAVQLTDGATRIMVGVVAALLALGVLVAAALLLRR